MSEAAFQELAVAQAEGSGWRVAHCRKTLVKQGDHCHYETTMPAGWPDLTLTRRGVLAFAELKVGRNKETLEQAEWRQLLSLVGGDTWHFLWTPDQWDDIVWFLKNAKKGMR